jgi:hypothetical protein
MAISTFSPSLWGPAIPFSFCRPSPAISTDHRPLRAVHGRNEKVHGAEEFRDQLVLQVVIAASGRTDLDDCPEGHHHHTVQKRGVERHDPAVWLKTHSK